MQKNVAGQMFTVFAFNRTTNVPLTGDAANISANIRLDNGTAAATNDVNPTETEDGFYQFTATQAETNADQIQLFPASSTADIQVISVPGIIFTTPVNFGGDVIQTGDAFARIGATGSGLTSLAQASIVTNARLAELDAANIPANIDTLLTRIIGTLAAGTHNPATAAQIAVLSDWLDAGRLDLILDIIAADVVNIDGAAMRGTDGANTTAPDNASIAAILVDTNELQANQGNWSTATGFSTHTPANVRTEMDSNSTQLASISGDTTALRGVFRRNTAISNIEFIMIDSTDDVTPLTGATVTGQRSIDKGAYANVSGTITEVGSGTYAFDALAADTNGEVITYKFAATGANDTFQTLYTNT